MQTNTATITLAGREATIAMPWPEDLEWLGRTLIPPGADDLVRRAMEPLDTADRMKAVMRALLIVAQDTDPFPGDSAGEDAVPVARALLGALTSALGAGMPEMDLRQADDLIRSASALEVMHAMHPLAQLVNERLTEMAERLAHVHRACAVLLAPLAAPTNTSPAAGAPDGRR